MNIGFEQEPFSVSEFAVGGVALVSVALIAFVGVTMSQQQSPPPAAAAAPPWDTAALVIPSPPPATSGQSSGGGAAMSRALQFTAPPAEPEVPPIPGPSAATPAASEETAQKVPAPVASEPPAEKMPAPAAAAPSAQPRRSTTQPGGFIEMLRSDDPEAAPPWKLADPAPKPAEPERKPLNRSEATLIQRRLHELGYYFGDGNGVWGVASRRALRDFKRMNGLPEDDRWDRETEQRLLAGPSVQARRTFVGRWALDAEECVQRDEAGRLVIDARGAETAGGKCDFQSSKQETASSWRIRAVCSASGKSWSADIGLRLVGPNLQWSSERGTETYVRCLKL